MNPLYARLSNLIVTRLVVVSTLLALAVAMARSDSSWANANINPQPLVWLAVAVGALSVAYFTWLRMSERYLLQGYVQLLGDVVAVTWLTYQMRDSAFPLAPLYLVIVFVAAMILPRIGTIAVGVACALAYVGLLVSFKVGLLVGGYAIVEQNERYFQNNPLLYVIAILALTVLGGQLAERLRRSDAELEAAARDLAQLRAFNERIVESVKSGLVTVDLTGRIMTFNRAAEEITGYCASRVRGKPLQEVFGMLHQAFPGEPSPNAKDDFRRFETDCRAADGRLLRLGFAVSPLTSEAGETTGYVFSFQDLTEILKLEEEIRRQDRLAALGKMAAGIAHEIRNPLAAMRGSIQLLQSELNLDEEQAKLMRIVLRESDRLNRTIEDFLRYARPRPLQLASVNVARLIGETISLLQHSPEIRPDHEIILDAPPDLPPITADGDQIKQVFWNLARNAVQAMPQGGRLTIAIRPTAEYVEIHLTDTGTGFPPENLARPFEPFNSNREGGTGLGMAIVYQIVSDHGGRVRIGNRTDGVTGAEVVVALPWEATAPASPPETVTDSRLSFRRTPTGVPTPATLTSGETVAPASTQQPTSDGAK
ncbi:MAG: ATP-binding protein [Chloracidobacterium sp.]|nr:ATP-binding protein [Chloracidobacterium sp.]MDW8217378.1 ATP-binding protein [Acidobacteriota bacterium]